MDKIVAIDLANYRLHDGPNVYRGRADLTVTVIDITTDDAKPELENNGEPRVIADAQPIVFPKMTGHPTTEYEEPQFVRKFNEVLAHEVAKQFYAYDRQEDVALDAQNIGR